MQHGVLYLSYTFESQFTVTYHESAYGFFDDENVVELFARIRKVNANAGVDEGDVA